MPELLSDRPEVEYLDGVPYAKVSPKLVHGMTQLALGRILSAAAGNRGITSTETRFRLGSGGAATHFIPDVSFVSIERLKALPKSARDEPPFAPDIAIEVRSPSDDVHFLALKIPRYLATGARLVLDVDPKARSIVAHDRTSVTHFANADTFAHEAVPWLRFDVREAFADQELL